MRNIKRGIEAMKRGDVDAMVAMAAPGFFMDDRRKGLQVEFNGSEALRAFDDSTDSTFDVDVLATRGDQFALLRVTETLPESGFTGCVLVVNQVDDAGLGLTNV